MTRIEGAVRTYIMIQAASPLSTPRNLMLHRFLSLALVLAVLSSSVAAQPAAKQVATDTFTHQEDVIYARKHGAALTLDVFAPTEKAIGRGVILCVSGGWV